MGSLAAAGLMTGVGQGLIDEQTRQNNMAKMEFDQAREVRLQQLQQEYTSKMTQAQQDHQDKLQAQELSAKGAISQNEIQKARDLEERKITATSDEGDKNRQNKLDVANIKASASANNKKVTSRWDFKSTPASTGFGPNGSMITTPAQDLVHDKLTAQTYVQQGMPIQGPDPADPTGKTMKNIGYTNNFYPPGIDPKSTRRAPPAAVQDLVGSSDPRAPDVFIKTYGYLPSEYIANQKAMMTTQQGSSMRQGSSNDDDDE